MIIFAELDVLQGPKLYEKIFEFRETRPFSQNFDAFGTGDLNFFMNSGSTVLIFAFIIIYFLFMMMLYHLTKRFSRSFFVRKIAMFAEMQTSLYYPLLKLFYEGAIELTIPATLGVVSIFGKMDAPDVKTWFATGDDALCSIITLVVFAIMFIMPFFLQWLMRQGKMLLNPWWQANYGAVYEDFDIRYQKSRSFIWFDTYRRTLVCYTVIILDGFPAIQSQIFIFQALATLWLQSSNKNLYAEKKMSWINYINELFLYVIVLCNPIFLLEHEDEE